MLPSALPGRGLGAVSEGLTRIEYRSREKLSTFTPDTEKLCYPERVAWRLRFRHLILVASDILRFTAMEHCAELVHGDVDLDAFDALLPDLVFFSID